MFFKERRKDLSQKMRYMGHSEKNIKQGLFLMYSPIGLILRSPKKIGEIIDKTYNVVQEKEYYIKENKRIDEILEKIAWDRIKSQHYREGKINLN